MRTGLSEEGAAAVVLRGPDVVELEKKLLQKQRDHVPKGGGDDVRANGLNYQSRNHVKGALLHVFRGNFIDRPEPVGLTVTWKLLRASPDLAGRGITIFESRYGTHSKQGVDGW